MHIFRINMRLKEYVMQKTHSEARKANEKKLREMGYRPGPTSENFSDFVTMKVLARKTHRAIRQSLRGELLSDGDGAP